MKKLISVILSSLMLISIFVVPLTASAAEGGSNGEFGYVISGNEVTITSYQGKQSNVTVPEKIDGNTVTAIGSRVFANKDASALRSVLLPSSISTLEDGAFTGLSSSFVLYYLGTKTEWDNRVSVGANNDGFTLYRMRFLYDETFWYCINTSDHVIVTASRDRVADVIIPGTIDGYTVTQIATYCFDDDWTTKTLSLPDTVTNLDYGSIGECSITSIRIGNGLKTISESAFEYNTHLTDIYYNGTEEDWAKIEIEESGNERLKEVQFHFIPEDSDGLEYHWNTDGTLYVSGYHGSKKDVTIPSKFAGAKVTSVGSNAFYRNETIKSVTIPSSVKSVGSQAFFRAVNLDKISLTEGLEIIGGNAFRETAIETIVIPSTVKRISLLAFFQCANLKDVTIPSGVVEIYRGAFADCAMKSVTIPASATYLDNSCIGCRYDSDSGKYIPLENFVVYGTKGSMVEKYAAQNGITFVDSSEAIIDTIKITNLYAPRVGKTLPDTADTNGHYTIDKIYWYDVYAEKWLGSSDTVVSGKQYEANIHVRADKGYKFVDFETITATVDDSPAAEITSVSEESHDEVLNIRLTYPAFENNITKVNEVEVTGVTVPVGGKVISKSADDSEFFSIQNVSWYDVSANKWMQEGDKFVVGKDYEVNVNVRAKDGYEFETPIITIIATVNGYDAVAGKMDFNEISEYLNIRHTFTATKAQQPETQPDTQPETQPDTQPETQPDTQPDTQPQPKDIDTVAVTNVVTPVDGVFPDFSASIEGGEIDYLDWFNETDSNIIGGYETFEEGKTYTAIIYIQAPSGKEFAVDEFGFSGVTVMVNGEAVAAQNVDAKDPKNYISVKKSFVAEAYEEPQPELTDISGWKVSGIKNKSYTGKAVTQSVKVTNGSERADIVVSYKNNKNVGTATVKIVGVGEYKGSITRTFKITKAVNPIAVKTVDKSVKLSAVKAKNVAVKGAVKISKAKGKVSCKITSAAKAIKKYLKISSKGVLTVKKWSKAAKGTYKIKVKVSAKGDSNYKSKSVTKTVKIKVK